MHIISGTADTEGAKYRVSSQTVGTSTIDFGTISADLITYSISYTLNNGTHGSTHPTSYNVTSSTISISNPTRTGYTFKGWSGTGLTGNSNKNIQIASGSIGNRSYTANWTANQYNITYKDQGNASFSGTHASGYPTSHTYGTATTLKSASKEGYTFDGWFTSQNCTGSAVTSLSATGYTANINLYAKWTKLPDMEVTVENYNSSYDGSSHEITVTPTTPDSGYTIMYGTIEGTYNQTSIPKTDAGIYTIYFKVTHLDYYPYTGSATITITQGDPTYATLPTIKEGLEYSGGAQVLINPGEVDFGTPIQYSLDGENWSTDIPTGENVGEYTVYFRVPEDANQTGIETQTLTVTISEVDKTDLNTLVDEALVYLEKIQDTNPEIAELLDAALTDIINDYRDNPNVTPTQVENGELLTAMCISGTKIEVAKEDISRIGDVEYTEESKALIDVAREAYDALTDSEKDEVSTENILESAEELYNAVDEVVKEIEGAKPAYTQEYKDALDQSKENYEALTDEQKEIFPDATKALLEDKETAYDVMSSVNAIGTVEYSATTKAKIDTAKQQYDNLTPEQKELVVNSDELFVAKENYEKVDDAVKKIEDIGKIEYSKETKESIDEARKFYDSLTPEQKLLVPASFVETLEAGEHSYSLRHGWGVTFLVLGIIVFVLGAIYLLMFFVFNRYTPADDKVIRVHYMGKEYGQMKLLTYDFRIIYRPYSAVFKYKGFADKLIVRDEPVKDK